MAILLQLLVRRCCPPLWKAPVPVRNKEFSLDVPCLGSQNEKDGELSDVAQVNSKFVGQVARIMGADPTTFREQDLKDSLEYLFPTGLFDKKARPFLMNKPLVATGPKGCILNSNDRPDNPGFFTGLPSYYNLRYEIFKIWRASLDLPPEPPTLPSVFNAKTDSEVVSSMFVKKGTMEDILSEELTDKQYEDMVHQLSKLSQLKSSDAAKELLSAYQIPKMSPMQQLNVSKMEDPVCFGYRKTAHARVALTSGTGQITVNSRSFLDYFPRLQDRQQVLYPLHHVEMLGNYDICAIVKGGGMTGQAGAIRLGISRCLASLPCISTSMLFTGGLLTKDPRKVERKKPGMKKARKKFAWVKR